MPEVPRALKRLQRPRSAKSLQNAPAHRARRLAGVEQAWMLSMRSTLATARKADRWAPGLFFPLAMAAVYASQFARATALPGFPEVDSFLQFILPATILQGIAFSASNAGTDMATDIETGFFDRLVVSPVARQSIFVGRVGGSAAAAGFQSGAHMAIFFVLGAPIESGLAGTAALVLVSAVLSVAISGFGLTVAMRTGSSEATQAMFPLVLMMVFVSSAFFPTELMKGWYQTVAEHNPFSVVVNPTRQLVISRWSWGDVFEAVGYSLLIALVSLSLAYGAYLQRLRRS